MSPGVAPRQVDRVVGVRRHRPHRGGAARDLPHPDLSTARRSARSSPFRGNCPCVASCLPVRRPRRPGRPACPGRRGPPPRARAAGRPTDHRRSQRPAVGDPHQSDLADGRGEIPVAHPGARPDRLRHGSRRAGSAASSGQSTSPANVPTSATPGCRLEQIDIARRMIAMYPDQFQLALSADDVVGRARGGQGRLAARHGGRSRHRELARRAADVLRARCRYMTLTHNVTLDWADAALDSAKPRRPHRLRSRRGARDEPAGDDRRPEPCLAGTMSDALDATAAPVMFSHSSARAVADVPRNVPDSILRRLRTNGGVVMVTFVRSFISNAMRDWADGADSLRQALQRSGLSQDECGPVSRPGASAHPRPEPRSPTWPTMWSTSATWPGSTMSASAVTTTAPRAADRDGGCCRLSGALRRTDPPRLE